MKLNKSFQPIAKEAEEVYNNGNFFQFNISSIIKDINSNKLTIEKETIDIQHWFKEHGLDFGIITESHLQNVDVRLPIIQAEIRINKYEIIDGHHRIKRAYDDDGLCYIESYKLKGEQLAEYLMSIEQYEAYIQYWNDKIDCYIEDMKRGYYIYFFENKLSCISFLEFRSIVFLITVDNKQKLYFMH